MDTEGNRVQGKGGDIKIDPEAKSISIDKEGTIMADGAVVDQLQVTDFEDYDYLVKLGDNLYTTVDGAREIASTASVIQGYTEQSNVNVVSEMVDMITITRAYEANQKMIRAMDGMMDKAVNSVGKLG